MMSYISLGLYLGQFALLLKKSCYCGYILSHQTSIEFNYLSYILKCMLVFEVCSAKSLSQFVALSVTIGLSNHRPIIG